MKNRENMAGTAFLRQLEEGYMMQFDYTLHEDVDAAILEKAWRLTLDDCPYFERSMETEEGKLFFVPHTCNCHVEEIENPDEAAPPDGPSFGKDLMWIQAKGNRIRTGVSHALTDGFGKNLFTRLLLYHYFCLKDGKEYQKPFADPATGAVLADPDSDVVSDALFPKGTAPEGLVPKEGAFVLPEIPEAFGVHQICVDDKKFREACAEVLRIADPEQYKALSKKIAPIGGLDVAAVYLLFGKVLQMVYPENEKRLSCRFPINGRALCNRPFMLRNASHGQAWLTHPASFFRDGAKAVDAAAIVRTIEAWLRPEVVGWEMDCLDCWRQGREVDRDFQMVFRDPTILISNVGNPVYEPQPGRITGYRDYVDLGLPCLYLFRIDNMRFLVIRHMYQSERILDLLEGFLR